DLLEQITGLGQPLPNWFAVVEEGLVRRGALALVEQPDWESRRHAVALLLRLAELSQPVPEWLPPLLETTLVGLLNDLSARSGGRTSQAEVASLVASCRGLALLAKDPQRRAAVAEALERAQLLQLMQSKSVFWWRSGSKTPPLPGRQSIWAWCGCQAPGPSPTVPAGSN
ncbi:MAG: hypothetical protein EBZ76_08640, partial [Synechococcaceae bacterium WB9_2_170]|nr:hypothetical protein [Synechococcaceae bacterium WB9_2_170]